MVWDKTGLREFYHSVYSLRHRKLVGGMSVLRHNKSGQKRPHYVVQENLSIGAKDFRLKIETVWLGLKKIDTIYAIYDVVIRARYYFILFFSFLSVLHEIKWEEIPLLRVMYFFI